MQTKIDEKMLINEFFNVEDDTLVLELTYDSLSDLVHSPLSQKGKIKILSTEFFIVLEYCFSLLRKKQAASLKINIKDKEGVEEKEIEKAIQSNLFLKLLELRQQNRNEILRATRLMILGSAFLLFSYLFSQATSQRLIFDVMTILGWVVVWEAGTHFILNRAEIHHKKKKYDHLCSTDIHVK